MIYIRFQLYKNIYDKYESENSASLKIFFIGAINHVIVISIPTKSKQISDTKPYITERYRVSKSFIGLKIYLRLSKDNIMKMFYGNYYFLVTAYVSTDKR